jgi:RNA polymerase-binding protein DksA
MKMEKTIDLETLQLVLEQQRLDLIRRIAKQAPKSEPQVIGSDRSALAQSYVFQQRKFNTLARAQRTIKQVEAALERMDEGTYGVCLSCGQSIQAGRLQALPHTEFCVHCKEAQETNEATR